MLTYSRNFLYATILLSAIPVVAQESLKSERFDQPVTGLGTGSQPLAAQTEARRSTIRNQSSVSNATAAAPAGQQDLTGGATQRRTTMDELPAFGAADDERSTVGESLPKQSSSRSQLNEFQRFVYDGIGQVLPIYGEQFFLNSSASYTPLGGGPVPADYPLGVGDEIYIRGSGNIDIDFRAVIDRNGTISLPSVGTIALVGVRSSEAENVIRNAVSRLYKGVNLNVSFGKLRAITVYVVGQARRPGTYVVSSLSTLVTALFASGGPNSNGSMRHVQVRRGGKLVGELDMYAFIAKGDKSGDIKLIDGDTIYIPSASGYVALIGKVNLPAIFELISKEESVESILQVAGGLPVIADPKRAFLERIDTNKNPPRSVEEFALDGAGFKRGLKNGDVLTVIPVAPQFSNAITLRGHVDQPVRVPYRKGMRLSDLIPSRESLITRNSLRKQNNALNPTESNDKSTTPGQVLLSGLGGLSDDVNWDYAAIERINRSDLSSVLISFNLGKVFTDPSGRDNLELEPGDTVTIFSLDDVAVPKERRRVFVRVEGEINSPGVYQMNSGDTLGMLLARAGGPTSSAYLFGTEFYREQVRKQQEIGLEKAADRLENQLKNEQASTLANVRGNSAAEVQLAESRRNADLLSAKEAVARLRRLKPTGRIAFAMSPNEKSFAKLPQITLENGDRLMIPSRPEFVQIFGAVNAEAAALWKTGRRVNDYLSIAGTTRDADLENIFILRVDGSVVSKTNDGWFSGSFGSVEILPGDSIIVPEKVDRETAWTKFTSGTREWAQIFANFGLGAAAVKTLRN